MSLQLLRNCVYIEFLYKYLSEREKERIFIKRQLCHFHEEIAVYSHIRRGLLLPPGCTELKCNKTWRKFARAFQLKLEHNVEQHVPSGFDDGEQERERGKRRRRKRKKKKKTKETLETFKANLPPSIADSILSLFLSLFLFLSRKSSTSAAVILPSFFTLLNYEIPSSVVARAGLTRSPT